MDPAFENDDIAPLIDAGALRILLYSHASDGIPGIRRVRDHRDHEAGTSIVHAEVCGVPIEARYARSRHMPYDGELRSPRINDETVRGALVEALRTAWPTLPNEARDEIGRIRTRNTSPTSMAHI